MKPIKSQINSWKFAGKDWLYETLHSREVSRGPGTSLAGGGIESGAPNAAASSESARIEVPEDEAVLFEPGPIWAPLNDYS